MSKVKKILKNNNKVSYKAENGQFVHFKLDSQQDLPQIRVPSTAQAVYTPTDRSILVCWVYNPEEGWL